LCSNVCVCAAMQRRDIDCQLNNGTEVDLQLCSEAEKPPQRQECYNDKCKGTWKVGEWSEVRTVHSQCTWVGAVLLILIVNRLFLAIRTSNPIYVMVVLCLRQPLEPTSTSGSILAHRSKCVGAAAGNAADCDISQKEILCI
jgi:hypothetical protein